VQDICSDETLYGSNLPVSAKNPINKAASIRQKLMKNSVWFLLFVLIHCDIGFYDCHHVYRIKMITDSTGLPGAKIDAIVSGGDKQFESNVELVRNERGIISDSSMYYSDSEGYLIDYVASYDGNIRNNYSEVSFRFIVAKNGYITIDTSFMGNNVIFSNDSAYFPEFYLRHEK
jgi:hypothetical protein